MITNETIQHLLNIMLKTILTGSAYPGQKADRTFFPDIELVQQTPEIILSDQHLSQEVELDVPGYECKIIPEDQLAERAAEQGDFPYLVLTELKTSPTSVVMSLQLKWAVSSNSQEMGKFYMSGGGVRVKFIQEDGEWVSPTGPMATWMS